MIIVQVDHLSEKTTLQRRIQGRIEIQKVDFAYPSRPQCLVLHEFTLEVKAGTSVGLVGRSGCGKSTIVSLIQRFYDVDRGVVRIDGVDVRELDIIWFRGFTALVSQEPVIFSGSVRDNIAFGKPEATENEIVEAAKAANAHEFISLVSLIVTRTLPNSKFEFKSHKTRSFNGEIVLDNFV